MVRSDRTTLRNLSSALNWFKAEIFAVDMENLSRMYEVRWKIILTERAELPEENHFVHAPTLCCLGRFDAAFPPASARESFGFIKSFKVKEFDAGHWIHLELPDALNASIHEFISRTL